MQIFLLHVLSDNLISFPDFERTDNNGVDTLIHSRGQNCSNVRFHRPIIWHLGKNYFLSVACIDGKVISPLSKLFPIVSFREARRRRSNPLTGRDRPHDRHAFCHAFGSQLWLTAMTRHSYFINFKRAKSAIVQSISSRRWSSNEAVNVFQGW